MQIVQTPIQVYFALKPRALNGYSPARPRDFHEKI
jgi:hypothetical protein